MFCFLLLVVALLLVLLSQEKRCAFAHSVAELRPLPNLQRTSICTAWKKGQCCRDICRFAHGAQELCATEGFRKTNMCRHAHGHQELKQPNHALLLAKEEAQQRSSSSLSCRTEAQHNDGEQLATATAAVAATGDNSSSRRSSISGGIRLQQENEEVYQKEQEQQEQQEQQEPQEQQEQQAHLLVRRQQVPQAHRRTGTALRRLSGDSAELAAATAAAAAAFLPVCPFAKVVGFDCLKPTVVHSARPDVHNNARPEVN
eukprot:GHVS01107782.1.p1 GENE.GHVS01107782.1~~GHVS01107782.1.p1  ORF type:complete len:258 (+),score=68.13 GHVS01107782.1:201-974(+)